MTDPAKPEHASFQAMDPVRFGTKAIAEADLPAMAKAIFDLREHFRARRYRSGR